MIRLFLNFFILTFVFAAGPAAGAEPARPAAIDLAALEQSIAKGALGKIAAVSVDQRGKRIYSRSFGNTRAGELVDIRSAGKSLTALAVGLAIEEGKLAGVDVPVWPLLGSGPGDLHNAITVRDLLTMSSALDCNDSVRKSPGQEEKMYRTKSWIAFAMAIPLRKNHARDAKGYGPFSYCTAGVFLLGRVVEKATGERFDRYVDRRLFAPLGIKAVEWRTSPSGEIQSGGQVRIGADDLTKVGRMVLDRGKWEGQQIVPETWIREMLKPHRQPGQTMYYGYLWWATAVQSPLGYEPGWMMMGNGGNVVAIFQDYDAVIVIQSQNYNKADASLHSFQAMKQILSVLPRPTNKPAATS